MNEEQQGFNFKLQTVDLIFVLVYISSLKIRSCKKLGKASSVFRVMINIRWLSGYITSHCDCWREDQDYILIYTEILLKRNIYAIGLCFFISEF